ncbi:hypothetical protein D9M72_545990 [compost metagenome]
MRAQDLTDSSHAFHVFPDVRFAHLDLDGVVPGSHPAFHLSHELPDGVVQVHARTVHLHGILPLAQQSGERGSGAAGLQVPQGKVRPGHGDGGQSPAAGFVQPLPQLVPHALGVRFEPGDERRDVEVQERLDRLRADGGSPGKPVTRAAVVRPDFGDDHMVFRCLRTPAPQERNSQQAARQPGDPGQRPHRRGDRRFGYWRSHQRPASS